MRASAISALAVALAACSIPAERNYLPIDAGHDAGVSGPFACYNQPLPTTAPMQVVIAGSVIDPYTGDGGSGASVQAFLTSAPTTPIFTTTAVGSAGLFTQDQGTGGFPRDLFLHVSNNGSADTVYWPAVPIVADTELGIQQLTTSEFSTAGTVAGVTLDTAKAQIVITVVDCNGSPIVGATVSTVPAGTVRYLVGATPNATAVATDTTGSALVFNVAPGTTTISAMSGAMTLRSHDLTSTGGTLTQTEIQP